jgi:hypothetical protein
MRTPSRVTSVGAVAITLGVLLVVGGLGTAVGSPLAQPPARVYAYTP